MADPGPQTLIVGTVARSPVYYKRLGFHRAWGSGLPSLANLHRKSQTHTQYISIASILIASYSIILQCAEGWKKSCTRRDPNPGPSSYINILTVGFEDIPTRPSEVKYLVMCVCVGILCITYTWTFSSTLERLHVWVQTAV